MIGPERYGPVGQLADLWRYRDVLLFLVWRDVRVRYRQTFLGIMWAVLQPLLMMVLFGVVFDRLAKMPSDGMPYLLFAYVGLLPWTYFANAVTEAGNSLVTNPDLITKVYVPRLLIPLAAVVAALVDFVIAAMMLVALMIYFRASLGASLLLIPPLVIMLAVLAAAVGTWMSALNVKYRDVRYALPFLMQIWLFATPVIYPSSLVPDRWKPVARLNPMAGIIDGFRSSISGRAVNVPSLVTTLGLTGLALVLAISYFARVERDFADVV